jgi:hypothetical protein
MAEESRAQNRVPGARPLLWWVILVPLVLWCWIALGLAVGEARKRPDPDPRLYPAQWQLGSPQVEPLRELAAVVDRRLPRGATVVADSLVYEAEERIYLHAWVRYLLPRQRVLRETPPRGPEPIYRLVVPPPRLELPTPAGETVLLHEPGGRLLRIEPAAERGSGEGEG